MLNTPDNPLSGSEARRLCKATGSQETRYYGSACRKCGGVVRNISGACIVCKAESGRSPSYIAKRADYLDKNKKRIAERKAQYDARRYMETADAVRVARSKRGAEIITATAACCGAMLTATRNAHAALSGAGNQKFCKHCRPDQLEALQPEAECYLYAAELDGRHGQMTGFGISAEPEQRWKEHRKNLRDEGMHVVGAVWVSQRMTRSECLRIESRLKTIADGIPVPGFKTESFKGHCLQTVIDLIADLT